jgi:cellular nucleic acid-binding protein
MPRGRTPAQALNMVANPYGKPREIQPTNTECEVCNRTIKTKDWNAHKNSKGHRKKEDDVKPKENQIPGSDNWSANASGAQDDAWGSGGGGFDTSGDVGESWGGSGGFAGDNTNGNARGGGGGGGCHKCGETGHIKRDCPQGGGGDDRACYGCGVVGHTKRECPQGGGGGGNVCFNCNQSGHRKTEWYAWLIPETKSMLLTDLARTSVSPNATTVARWAI